MQEKMNYSSTCDVRLVITDDKSSHFLACTASALGLAVAPCASHEQIAVTLLITDHTLQGVVFNKHRQWKMGVLRGYMANIKETFLEELTTFLHF